MHPPNASLSLSAGDGDQVKAGRVFAIKPGRVGFGLVISVLTGSLHRRSADYVAAHLSIGVTEHHHGQAALGPVRMQSA
jgi:hypothetical protein